MPPPSKTEALEQEWEAFLKNKQGELRTLLASFPERRGLPVTYGELVNFRPRLAETLLDSPTASLAAAERALSSLVPPDAAEARGLLCVRVTGLPQKPIGRVEVRELRAKHLGKFVAIKGIVRRVSQVSPRVRVALYQCHRCRFAFEMEQEEKIYLQEPVECPKNLGGCGKPVTQTRFKLIDEPLTDASNAEMNGRTSKMANTQVADLQESPENLRGGEQSLQIKCFLDEDLCGSILPGDSAVINGIVRGEKRASKPGTKSAFLNLYLDVNSIEREPHEYDEVPITPEDEAAILAAARDPELVKKMVASIAPTISGWPVEKESLWLQLFGGVMKKQGKTRLRGDMHILLVGDPGVGKSQILQYLARLAPRGLYTSGKAATAAGLTATAVKDEHFGESRWTLEAGALVIADRGLCAVDEFDKMDKKDRSSIHEAMEQQTVSVSKAGINATLQARCSILAAANPKFSRFEEGTPFVEQIDLPPALFSRFDVIFSLTDQPQAEKDAELASFILSLHRAGEIREQRAADSGSPFGAEQEAAAARDLSPPFSDEFLRKYVSYARKNIFPVMTPDAEEEMKSFYVGLRAKGAEMGKVSVTPRQMEALIRLSEASARAHMRRTVTRDDAERAVNIIRYYLTKIASEGGVIEYDIITGTGKSERTRMKSLTEIVQSLDQGQGVPEELIIEEAEKQGMDRDKALRDLNRLKTEGHLFEPRQGKYRMATR